MVYSLLFTTQHAGEIYSILMVGAFLLLPLQLRLIGIAAILGSLILLFGIVGEVLER